MYVNHNENQYLKDTTPWYGLSSTIKTRLRFPQHCSYMDSPRELNGTFVNQLRINRLPIRGIGV